MNIPVYNMTSKYFNHKPTRNRKLLLHKKEINKLSGSIKTKGTTIIPLSLYINDRNKAKLKIAIAKGKKLYDKRQDLKERDWKRDKERMLKETYNELNKYYEIADNLSEKVSESVELSIKQKQDILYPIIDEIKEYANIMIENYILYLKNKEDTDKLLIVKENINKVLERIDFFKNKVYDIYDSNNK